MRRDNPFEEIEQLLDRMGSELEVPALSGGTAVDVADRGDEFVVTADLPGFDRDEVDVTLADTTLRIEAEHGGETEVEEGEYLRRERTREAASRTVRLPAAVDEAGVTATLDNGVLTVRLPKRDAEGGREIEIE